MELHVMKLLFFYNEKPLQDKTTSWRHFCRVNFKPCKELSSHGSSNTSASPASWFQEINCNQGEDSNFRPDGNATKTQALTT